MGQADYRRSTEHALDCELKSFFDTGNHDRLMALLREKVEDRLVWVQDNRSGGKGWRGSGMRHGIGKWMSPGLASVAGWSGGS